MSKAETGMSPERKALRAKTPSFGTVMDCLEDLAGLVKEAIDNVRSHFIGKFCAQDVLINELRQRVAALEARSMKYAGVYSEQSEYMVGDVVTHQGAGWIAVQPSKGERPGTGKSWKLAIKSARPERGRDGK